MFDEDRRGYGPRSFEQLGVSDRKCRSGPRAQADRRRKRFFSARTAPASLGTGDDRTAADYARTGPTCRDRRSFYDGLAAVPNGGAAPVGVVIA